MTFAEFDIDPRCLSVLDAQRIVDPTPVQAQAIPAVLTGGDLVAVAQTGTGKTLAFSLPALTRLAGGRMHHNMMLVLAPTRELAIQVNRVIEEIGKPLRIRTTCLYGGVGLDAQEKALRRGCTVVVATPGRLLDHMGRGNIRFNHLQILVLDEADRMLDMGFLPDIQRILAKLPEGRQTLMFSATFPDEISRLASGMMRDPERITVGAISKPVETVRQILYTVHRPAKVPLLLDILRGEGIDSALIFMRTKRHADRIEKALRKNGLKVQIIHGDRSQKQRQRALESFRSGQVRFLVATDVAARGLDIEGISHVINFDIPENADDYIHRIGRTARASAQGDAITFVCPDEHIHLETIERALGRNLPRAEWEGAASVLSLFHAPEEKSARPTRSAMRRRRSLLRRR